MFPIVPKRSVKHATGGGGGSAPTISGISPSSGSAGGGTSVVITGTNFSGVTGVSFGGTAATSYVVNSATQITAVAPAHAAGAANVSVTTSAGTATDSGAFTFTSGGGSPVLTNRVYSDPITGGGHMTGSGATQTYSAAPIGSGSPQRMVIIATSLNSGVNLVSGTLTPNVGSPVSLTIVEGTSDGAKVSGIAYAVLGSDADTATTVDVSLTYDANPFAITTITLWTTPSAGLASTTPTGHASAHGTATSQTVHIATSSGGFIVAAASNSDTGATGVSISGTETFTMRSPGYAFYGGVEMSADASGVSTNASSAVTATYSTSTAMSIVAAAWR